MLPIVFDKITEVMDMVIRSGKAAIAKWLFAAICMFILLLWFTDIWLSKGFADREFYDYLDEIVIMAFNLLLAVYLALMAIVECRTITLSKRGCEITWWNFRKFWTWEELKCRKWIEYSSYINKRSPQDGYGVIFLSTSSCGIPWFANASMMTIFRPMSRVGIHFLPRGYQNYGNMENSSFSFAVDKDTFLYFIKSIGLEIEDIDHAQCKDGQNN